MAVDSQLRAHLVPKGPTLFTPKSDPAVILSRFCTVLSCTAVAWQSGLASL